MLFSSMIFLWIFLPLVIAGNFLLSIIPFKSKALRIRAKNIFLVVASFIFYAFGGIYYLLIMIASISINYTCGYLIHSNSKKGRRRLILVVAIVLNIGMLFYFKYFNMLIIIIESFISGGGIGNIVRNMIDMRGTGALGFKTIVLPIGISFFTFQAMSYVVDMYTGKAKVQKNPMDFALYVALFPQLIAGPIVQYSDVAEEINDREESVELFFEGQKRFSYGLAKKVILANTFAQVADQIWSLEVKNLGAGVAWLGIMCYTFQIYYDFSGYSDMAIGLGRMFGFHFKENFRYPYMSLSIQEFWRRWHISLGSWFREYVYIPLGGNRKGLLRTCVNTGIVFLLTGIWHGANFTFIVWGLMYAVLMIMERLFLSKALSKNPVKIINWLYSMLFVIVGWVIFRSDTIIQARNFIVQMFSFGTGNYSVLSFLSMKLIVVFVIAVLGMGILERIFGELYSKVKERTAVLIVDYTVQLMLLAYSIMVIIGGTYNPFIYFQF